VFISHMAEMNPDLCAGKAGLLVKSMPWVPSADPAVATGRFRPGEATLINLAPQADSRFTLLIAPVTAVDAPGEDRMTDLVRGWLKPELPLADFLECYSVEGGTHHSAIVYGDVAEDMVRFAELMGWDPVILG
jgi:L-arabinose isomerase